MAAKRTQAQRTEKLLNSLDEKQVAAADRLLTRFERLLRNTSSDSERREVIGELSTQFAALNEGVSDLSTQLVSRIADNHGLHLTKSYYYPQQRQTIQSKYQSIVNGYFESLLQGDTKEDAMASAKNSFEQVSADQLNKTRNDTIQHASRAVDGAKVIGYRRIVHPEMSSGGACGLCIVASTQMYTDDHLNAIHERCKCTVLPVFRTTAGKRIDPGYAVNRRDLGKLYEAAGDSTKREGLKRTRWKRSKSGELEPEQSTLVANKKGIKRDPGALKAHDQSITTGQPATTKAVKKQAAEIDKAKPKDKEPKVESENKTSTEKPKVEEVKTSTEKPKTEEVKIPSKASTEKPNTEEAKTPDTITEATENVIPGGPKSTALGKEDVKGETAPEADPDKYFSDSQKETAQVLRHTGVDIRAVADHDIDGRQAPDAIVDGMTADVVRVAAPTAASVLRAARSVTTSAEAVVMDGSKAGLTLESAREGLMRTILRYGLRLLAIVIVCVDGILRWMSS